MGIKVSNGVRNAGNVGAMSAGVAAPGGMRNYDFFLDIASSTLYFYKDGALVSISGAGVAQTLTDVLQAGNNTSLPAIFKSGATVVTVDPTQIKVEEAAVSTQITTQGFKVKWSATSNTVYQLLNYPTFATCNQYITPKPGYTLIGATGVARLVNGVATVTLPLGLFALDSLSVYTFGIQSASGVLGVQYKGAYISADKFSITSLRLTTATEVGDQSDVFYTITQRIV